MTMQLPEHTTRALTEARASDRGRFADLLIHDGELRQSIIALTQDTILPAHNSPPAGSIQILHGTIRVQLDGQVQQELYKGELWTLTHERHEVQAMNDAVFLLTTVTSVQRDSYS